MMEDLLLCEGSTAGAIDYPPDGYSLSRPLAVKQTSIIKHQNLYAAGHWDVTTAKQTHLSRTKPKLTSNCLQ